MPVILCGEGCAALAAGGSGPCTAREVSYAGAVLGKREYNGYDDSDFYAIVWDATARTLREVWYASTASWTYHNGAIVDATPDVIEQAEAALVDVIAEKMITEARAAASKPAVGKTVRSTTTRGQNVDVVGQVRWMGNGHRRGSVRVGIAVAGESKYRFLDVNKVEVVDPAAVDEAEIREYAKTRAQSRVWQVK